MFFECQHVTKNFGALTAVDDVSFELDEGEVLGIMGPNGAGKSTLMNLIMGVYPLTKGDIYFKGEKISGLSTNDISRRGIGRTYQIPQPFNTMTVMENLLVGEMYGQGNRSMKDARQKAFAILEQVGLADKAGTVASQLGLLNLKRLELARALSLRPRLLLLDEIAGGLVQSEVDKLQRLITGLKESGQTMIIIEHVLSVMFGHSDRIMVLDFGEPIALDTPQEIVKDEQVIEIYLGEDHSGPPATTAAVKAAPEQTTPLLSVSEVSAGYGDFQALFNVALDIFEGEIVGLIGLNGAGKTTLIRAITNRLSLLSGQVTFRGQSIHQGKPYDISELGIAQAIEGRKIFPLMTVRENLEIGAYPPRARAKREQTIGRIFQLFPRLAERVDQLGGTLSGGEQQMLAIGRALMALPELLILDEVSLGLAPLIIDDLYRAIREINAAGVTVLLVEQNVHRSLEIAHRAYIIERGQIMLSGPTEELKQNKQVQEAYFGFEEEEHHG
jgi:branched-chain amino acid transport system ATP-binding protein